MKTLKLEDIHISDNIKLLDKEQGITPFVASLLEKMYFEIPKGKEKTLKKLIKYTNQFPKVPVFKNFLMTYYAKKGNEEKVKEVNNRIIKEHPNYLYAKINYAATLLEENKIEETKKILGNSLLLHELLPNRTVFLLDEIISYYGFTIYFLDAIEEVEEADNRLEILQEIDGNNPKVQEIEGKRFTSFFSNIDLLHNFEDDYDRYDGIIIEKRRHLQTNTPPIFNYKKQIKYLYTETVDSISIEQLNELLNLDKELLGEDLIKVLYDTIYRYDFFSEGNYEEDQLDFSLHAFNILLYLRNEKALEVILDLLRQDFDFTDFWFGDLFMDYIEHAICLLCENKEDILLDFVKEEYIHSISRSSVIECFMKGLDFKSPIKRKESVKKLEELINFFIENKHNQAITNTDFYSFFVGNLIEYGIIELLPQIKEIYDSNNLHEDFCGSYDEIREDIKTNDKELNPIHSFKSIDEVYEKFKIDNNFDFLDEEYDEEDDDDEGYNFINKNESQFIETVINSKEKIGRNEPCFCGSGKKYKKCCINK